jgi:membrane protein
MKLKDLYPLARDAGIEWWEDKSLPLAAAVAFYVILSLSPLVIVVLAISGWLFGAEAAQGALVHQIQDLVGPDGAKAIEAMIRSASEPKDGIIATIFGLAMLIFGATGAFVQLQDALNSVWEVEERARSGIWSFFTDRLLSFAFVCSLAFLLLVSLIVNAALTAVGSAMAGMLPGWTTVLMVFNFCLSFAITLVLFAMIFKLLPDVKVAWKDVWVGAFVTTVLFTLGKFLIGLYLGSGSVGTAYGAAGSLVVLLLWIYYSTLILLYGAEFTQVYANRFGHGLQPKKAKAKGTAQEQEWKVPAEPKAAMA